MYGFYVIFPKSQRCTKMTEVYEALKCLWQLKILMRTLILSKHRISKVSAEPILLV